MKGYIYLLTLPLEKYLTSNCTSFYKKDTPNYHKFYSQVISSANITRLANTDSKFILLTEHIVDDNNAYVCLINYAGFEETTSLTLYNNFKAYDLNDNLLKNLNITLTPNNYLILKLKK